MKKIKWQYIVGEFDIVSYLTYIDCLRGFFLGDASIKLWLGTVFTNWFLKTVVGTVVFETDIVIVVSADTDISVAVLLGRDVFTSAVMLTIEWLIGFMCSVLSL